MPYADKTRVPIDVSKKEIESTLTRYGASSFGYFSEPGKAIIVFEAKDRRLRFDLPLPTGGSDKDAKEARRRWRAFLLCIKAKLESVASEIETFEEAFLAHVVLGDGLTVYQHTRDRIAVAYQSGEIKALLPPAPHKPEKR